MIARLWRGWTTAGNSRAYETLLRTQIFPAIEARSIPGYRGIELLRRASGPEIEFVTLMWFDSLEAVRTFAGPDLELAVVPPAARALLARFDERSVHYDVLESSVVRPGKD
jgi:heme-degrading monooxygenase HmoA